MDVQQFLADFGHIANAPNGVVCLRELILALAVQGRLVEQLEAEEPATVQVERIRGLARALPITGRRKNKSGIKGSSFLPTAAQKIPKGWDNVPLCELVRVLNGRAYSKTELLESGTPVLRVGNLFTSDKWYYSNLELEEDKYCERGDLLYAWSASFGPFIWSGKKVIYHYHIWKLDPFSSTDLNKRYLYTYLQERTQEIKAAGHGISMAHMTKERFEQLSVLVPPLEEQSRIIAKVDELMALCDKLEGQQQERRAIQNALRQSTLQSVAAATSPYELQTTWERLAESFGGLFQSSEDVEELRNLILDLAVHGLLFDQCEMDKSITKWLSDIFSKKSELVKKKLIGKQTALADVDENEHPFLLPKGWIFVRLGQITNKIGSGSTPRGGREVYVKEGIPFLRSQNIWNDGLRLADVAFITPNEHARMSGTAVFANDLLLNITGASLGRCALVPDDFGEANVSQHVTIIRPNDPSIKEYLHLCLLSPYSQAMIWGRQVGMAREGLSKKVLEQFEIPIPPLTEQKRIVTRVTQLMSICDQLESQLKDARRQAERLAIASVSSLTGITSEQEEEGTVKVPQTELIATLRLGQIPDIKAQAPLATILARHNGEMSANDLWQRFGSEIDAFYAQLKTEVTHGWIMEPTVAEMREKITTAVGA